VCSIGVAAPVGNTVVFAISTYATPNGTGTPLAIATVSSSVATSTTPTIALTLNGVVNSLAIGPSAIHAVADGTKQTIALTIVPKDASGAIIVGTDAFASPIALAIANDPNGALSLDRTSLGAPSSVTLTYDSSKALVHATISASVGGVNVSAPVTPLVVSQHALTMSMDDPAQSLVVSEDGFSGQFSATPVREASQFTAATQATGITATVGSQSGGSATVTIAPPLSGKPIYSYPAGVTQYYANDGVQRVAISDGFATAYVPVNVSYRAITYTQIASPFDGSQLFALIQNPVAGPDGNFWFISADATGAQYMVRVSAKTNALTTFKLAGFGVPDGSGNTTIPTASTIVGPDGNLWFGSKTLPAGSTLPNAVAICRFTIASGALACYSGTNATTSQPPFVVGSYNDKVLFLGNSGTSKNLGIGTIDPSTGTIAAVTQLSPASAGTRSFQPSYVNTLDVLYADNLFTQTPDGKVWYLNTGTPLGVASVDPATGVTTTYKAPVGYPASIASTPDGKVWLGDGGTIGYVDTTAGTIVEQPTSFTYGTSKVFTGLAARSDGELIAGRLYTHYNGYSIDSELTPFQALVASYTPATNTLVRYAQPQSIAALLDTPDNYISSLSSNKYSPCGIVTTGTDAWIVYPLHNNAFELLRAAVP
jgi:hypothetical protein